MNKLLVSISCLTYNHSAFIKQCLDGFFSQECDFEYEILIYDDASADGTQYIIREYQEKYPGIIKPIFQTENRYSKGERGIMARCNFPRAQGKYIALCEGDDYWINPLKLQNQITFLESHANIDACFTNAIIHDHISNQKREYNQAHELKEDIVSNELIYRVGGSIYPTCTLVFRKELLNHIDLSAHGMAGDEQLIFAIANISKVYYMDFISGVYNRWQGGAFSGIKDDKKKLLTYRKGEIKGYRKFGKQLTPENKALLNKKKITAIDYVLQNSSGILPILKYALDNGIKKTLQLLRKKWRNHYSRS